MPQYLEGSVSSGMVYHRWFENADNVPERVKLIVFKTKVELLFTILARVSQECCSVIFQTFTKHPCSRHSLELGLQKQLRLSSWHQIGDRKQDDSNLRWKFKESIVFRGRGPDCLEKNRQILNPLLAVKQTSASWRRPEQYAQPGQRRGWYSSPGFLLEWVTRLRKYKCRRTLS